RHLMGLRAAAFLSAGIARVPFWKFILVDTGAALLGVPTGFALAYFFTDQVHEIVHDVRRVERWLTLLALVALAAWIAVLAWRKPWHAIFRLLGRDERVFAVLLAVAMVGGLATLGLVPLRPRQRIDLFALVVWFALYKLGIFALVTVQPRATRAIFLGALAI